LGATASDYQVWYTLALGVVRDVVPDRLAEFEECYRNSKRKNVDILTYTIGDFLDGITVTRFASEPVFNTATVYVNRFLTQINILRGAETRLASVLGNIEGTVRAELFDNELDIALELQKGHLRAAGAVAGVVLERHLQQIAHSHGVRVAKKQPTLADLNDPLKAAAIYDVPRWRQIQRLADLRNLCVHHREREPTPDEVRELIDTTRAVVKSIS